MNDTLVGNILSTTIGALLRPQEQTYLRSDGHDTIDQAYRRLRTAYHLDDPVSGVRRMLLLDLLDPAVSTTLRSDLARQLINRGARATPTTSLGVSPVSLAIAEPDVQPLPGAKVGFESDFLAGWNVRDQHGQPTCVAEATVAGVDLLHCVHDGGAFPTSSARFLYERMGHYNAEAPPEGAEKGYRKLAQARDALINDGVCSMALWADAGALDAIPDACAVNAARNTRLPQENVVYWERNPSYSGGLARKVYDFLSQRQPVMLAVPAYSSPFSPVDITNWSEEDVLRTGTVRDPRMGEQALEASGHAFCVLAFQPSIRDTMNGYFIFRNSVGDNFAYGELPDPDKPPPQVPAHGYGAISATHVELYCWEMLTFHL